MGVEVGELSVPGVAGSLQETDAAVPAEDGVVVARGANFFGVGEALERVFKERQDRVGRLSVAELGLGAAFVKESRIVELFIAIGEVLEGFFDLAVAV